MGMSEDTKVSSLTKIVALLKRGFAHFYYKGISVLDLTTLHLLGSWG